MNRSLIRSTVYLLGVACIALWPVALPGCAGDNDDHDLEHRYQWERRGGSHEHHHRNDDFDHHDDDDDDDDR